MPNVLVAGAGGFIGGHLVGRLLAEGNNVLAVDIKRLCDWHQVHDAAYNQQADLRNQDHVPHTFFDETDHVYNLACDMGGMGYIETHRTECMLSVQINVNLLQEALAHGVKRYFFASSACVYPSYRQDRSDVAALKESDVYPADPENGYGWEKLFSERLCWHFYQDHGLQVRVGRYHNVYGPYGTYDGGREKAPAAICRKVAEAVITGKDEIHIWGDGKQTRSFMHIQDCIEGTRRLMESDLYESVNIGSEEMVSIDELVSVVEEIAGIKPARSSSALTAARLRRYYITSAPKGVRGRSSDNTMIRERLNWEPSIPLINGMRDLYSWIYGQMTK